MRALVFLLVLANLGVYAYTQGLLGSAGNPDAARISQQVSPERIRIVSRGAQPPAVPSAAALSAESPAETPAPGVTAESPPVMPGAAGSAPATMAPAVEKSAPPEKIEEEARPAEPAAPVCLAWSHLTTDAADRLMAVLATRAPAFRIARQGDGGDNSGWWVYIPPLAGKAEADKKAAELRQLGVTDYFAIQEGPNRHAISLGVFTTEKGGNDRLAEVKAKGVRSARLTRRPGKDGTVTLRATGPAEERGAAEAAGSEILPKTAAQACS